MPTGLLLNMAVPLRQAILGLDEVTARLAQWEGEPAIFTRRPAPEDGPYPLIMISPDISISYPEDYLVAKIPNVRRDLIVYGQQPDQYRVVEEIGYLLKQAFHQNRFALDPPGFHVIDCMAAGPAIAPTDDEKLVARVVSILLRLQDLAS